MDMKLLRAAVKAEALLALSGNTDTAKKEADAAWAKLGDKAGSPEKQSSASQGNKTEGDNKEPPKGPPAIGVPPK